MRALYIPSFDVVGLDETIPQPETELLTQIRDSIERRGSTYGPVDPDFLVYVRYNSRRYLTEPRMYATDIPYWDPVLEKTCWRHVSYLSEPRTMCDHHLGLVFVDAKSSKAHRYMPFGWEGQAGGSWTPKDSMLAVSLLINRVLEENYVASREPFDLTGR